MVFLIYFWLVSLRTPAGSLAAGLDPGSIHSALTIFGPVPGVQLGGYSTEHSSHMRPGKAAR